MCRICGTVGDEEHYVVYRFPLVERGENLREEFQFDWLDPSVMRLFSLRRLHSHFLVVSMCSLNLSATLLDVFKRKTFFIAIDFDGAFERVSRSILIRKLIRFGAGTVFVLCIASI